MKHNHNKARKALDKSLIITLVFFFVELIGGFLTNSLALLSDAAHMFTHIFALFMAWGALKFSCRLPSYNRTFGLHRIEIFSALINGLVLVGFGIGILYNSFLRLGHPSYVYSQEMLVIAIIGLFANLYVVYKLHGFSDLNIKGAFLHVIGDTLSSILVIIGAVLMIMTQNFAIDSVLGIIIAIIIIVSSFKLIFESLHILLEGTPRHINVDEVIKEMKKDKRVKDVHSVHIWSLCSNIIVMSAHVLVNKQKINDTCKIINELNKRLDKFGINHTTFQFECKSCSLNSKFRHITH